MTTFKISKKNFPSKLPISPTVLYAFLMYYFQAPGWAWGVFATFFTLGWIAIIYAMATEKTFDLFQTEPKEGDSPVKSKWMERVAKAMKERDEKKKAL